MPKMSGRSTRACTTTGFSFFRRNIAWLVERYWRAGCSTVITGHLTCTKQPNQEGRDRVDQIDIVDTKLCEADDDFRYIEIDNGQQSVDETVAHFWVAIPVIGPTVRS